MKPLMVAATLCLLCLLFACRSGSEDKEYLPNSNDSVSVTGLTGDSVKLVKTVAIRFKVKDVEESILAVSKLAKQYGGMLTHQSLEAAEEQRTEMKLSADSLLVIASTAPGAEITARVPSHHLEAFLFDVSSLGYYTSNSRLHIDDKSLVYLHNVLKQQNRKETLAQVPARKKGMPAAAETILLKDEAIEQHIANEVIDVEVAYSTVALSLFQNAVVRREVMANTNMNDYRLPFWQRLGHAVTNGCSYFLETVLALAHFWVFLLAGIAVYILYKQRMQKRKLPVLNAKTE